MRYPLFAFCVVILAGSAFAQTPPPRQRLAPGQRVEVKGRLAADDSIEATRIRLQDRDDGSKIEGPVAEIDVPQRRLVIAGFIVSLQEAARIERDEVAATLDQIATGDVVEAKGTWSDNRLHAFRLRIRGINARASAETAEAEIKADVERVEPASGQIVVLGHRVKLARGGKLVDERSTVLDGPVGRLRREDDDLDVPPLQVGEWLTLGGRMGGDMRGHRRLPRASGGRERQDVATAGAQLLASAFLPRGIELYAKVGAERLFMLVNDGGPLRDQADVRVYEAYAVIGADAPVAVQIGRQRFRDQREWFYDEYVDAVRLHVGRASWRAEAAIADGIFAGPPEMRSRSDQRHTIVSFTKRAGRRTEGSVFLVQRDDRSRLERPLWLGGEWNGRAMKTVKYWALGAVRRGQSNSEQLRGWAADAGMAWRWPTTYQPSVTVSYALASGDKTGSDGRDTRFRQTGLEDNQARLYGLKRFAQYGEVLDPELSNLAVLTLGAGAAPFARTTIDLIYHRYTQRELRRSLPSNRLNATGTGRSLNLGNEVDVIVAIQQIRRVDFSVVAGIFVPGAGVATPARAVLYWKPEVRFFF